MPGSPVKNMKSKAGIVRRWLCHSAVALAGALHVLIVPAIAQDETNVVADSVSLDAIRAGAQELTVYELAFVARDTLATDATIMLDFPPSFDLAAVEIAGSQDVDGGFRLTREQQRVSLQRSGLGTKLAPGRRVRIKLGLIQNPDNPAAAAPVQVSFRLNAETPATQAMPVRVRFNAN